MSSMQKSVHIRLISLRTAHLVTYTLSRHLIADHLGWFKEGTQGGNLKTIEDILRARGETVRRGTTDGQNVIEYTE